MDKKLGLLALIILLLTTAVLSSHSLIDLDIWLHCSSGHDILSNLSVTDVNSYSFTNPEYRWHNHEWLFQIFVSLFHVGGIPGLNLLRLALCLAIAFLLFKPVINRLSLFLPATISLLLLWPRFLLRPELVSSIFLLIAIKWILAEINGETPNSKWGKYRTIVLSLIWAQFHGFFIILPMLWLLVALLKRNPRYLLLGLTSWAISIISPGHIHTLLYPITVASQFSGDGINLHNTIAEMVPLLETSSELGITTLVFKLTAIWGAIWIISTAGRVPVITVLLWVATLFLAISGRRNIGLFGITFFLIHSHYQPAAKLLWSFKIPLPKLQTATRILAPLLSIIVLSFWLPGILNSSFYLGEAVPRRTGLGISQTTYPLQEVALLKGQSRVANNIDAAGAMIIADYKVMIDGRTEAYPGTSWSEYKQFLAGNKPSLQYLETINADAVLLAHSSGATNNLIKTLSDSDSWHLAQLSSAGILFLPEKIDSPLILKPETADQSVTLASALALIGDDSAYRTLLKFRDSSPVHPILLHNLGNIEMANGNLRSALSCFVKAIKANPRQMDSLLNAGVCNLQLRNTDEAVSNFKEYLKYDNRADVWFNLSIAYLQLNEKESAKKAIANGLKSSPAPGLYSRFIKLQQSL
jgi:tetratricopeptide (TPR) repeat protein